MNEVTHRQLRNESGEVLRRVAAGETIVVTNHGHPAALIGPATVGTIDDLAARGQVRRAIASPASLRAIVRRTSETSTSEIVDDVRGSW